MVRVLVLLAEGVEEMEAVITIDVLRRCGIEVVAASTGTTCEVTASRGVRLIADALLDNTPATDFDGLVLPGGAGGSRRLANNPHVLELVRTYVQQGKRVAAVCAAPTVLQAAGVLNNKRFTCHPGVRDQFAGAVADSARVVTDGLFITSQGPGTSMEFALAIARQWVDARTVSKVADGLLLPDGVS